jgi:NAD(P)-dependent dehydrogenase (short-subunit alcohol dehydrogenase family)
VVTGAANGMGRASAIRLAEEGADVVLLDLDREGLAGVTKEVEALDRAAHAYAINIGDSRLVEEVARDVGARLGFVDVLVNNAGTVIRKPLFETTDAELRRTVDTNLFGSLFCAREFGRYMGKKDRPWSSIVNIVSAIVDRPVYNRVAYHVAKGGQHSLTHALAFELGQFRIRVNDIFPGTTVGGLMITKSTAESAAAQSYKDRTVLGRFCEPEEIAAAVAFLASDEASYITGATLRVDGGLSLGTAGNVEQGASRGGMPQDPHARQYD